MREVVRLLIEQGKTISTMESCTGGALASAITNIEGSSDVIEYSAVTYSNKAKIKCGVDSKIIEKYSVYSIETAREMAFKISEYTLSTYGVGITGKLDRPDKNNMVGKDNVVFISIYDRENNIFYDYDIEVSKKSREENKDVVLEYIKDNLINILDEEKIK